MNKLKIGWSRKDISTELPVELRGQFHMRVNLGTADPIYSTCLVLDSGDDYVIFVGLDLTSLEGNMMIRIRDAIKKQCPAIDPLKIIFNTTHTHTAPFTGTDAPRINSNLPEGVTYVAPSSEWQVFFVEQVVDSVCEAWSSRKAGKIGYGYGYAVVAHSRRVTYFDDLSERPDGKNDPFSVNGHAKMYGNTNDDMFSGYEAGADHFLNLMFTFSPEGKLTGAIVNIPCPSQNSEMEWNISADYWADIRNALRKEYGDIFVMPQCAAAGDLSPRILHYKDAQARRFRLKYGDSVKNTEHAARRDIAQRVAFGFGEVLDWAKKEQFDEVEIKHITTNLDLDKRKITNEDYEKAKKTAKELEGVSYENADMTDEEKLFNTSQLRSLRNRTNLVMTRYEAQEAEPTYTIETHIVKIGNIAFTTNPFELYMDFMHRIQARSPFEQTFIVQLSPTPGGHSSYLPTVRGKENRGYSSDIFGTRVSPEGGQQFVEATVRMLKDIHG